MKAMKKVLALALALAMVVTAVPVTSAEAANLTAGKSKKITYYVGKTNTLKLTGVKASNIKSTTWSKNGSKAVNLKSKAKTSAKVQVVKAGKAKVTATVKLKSGKTKKYTMNITAKNPTLTVKASSTTLKVGETAKLTVTKKPSTATVKYSSSDEAVASVSKGVVTANGIGKATITTKLTCGSKTVTKNITVEVTGQDGITATLASPLEGYADTVLVNQPALIKVQVLKDGKPVANTNAIFQIDTKLSTGAYSDYGPANYGAFADTMALSTDENGTVVFVLSNLHSGVKASDTSYVASIKYTVTVGDEKTEGVAKFAAIGTAPVQIVNNHDKDTTNNIKPGTNYKNGDGVAETASMDDYDSFTDEYVESQQVSSAEDNHAVTITGGYPVITLPSTIDAETQADKLVDPINETFGEYHTYEYKPFYYTLKQDPSKLTYATLNFANISLSEYSKIVVETYKNEADAKDDKVSPISTTTYTGPLTQPSFDYQIPLNVNYSGLCVKVMLVSQGRVDADKNKGFTIKDVTYVFKKQTGTKAVSEPYKNAKVEWAVVDTQWTAEKTIDTGYGTIEIGHMVKNNTTGIMEFKQDQEIKVDAKQKLTYKIPTFPYTGVAVLTKYDENGKVAAYYAVSTVNGSKAFYKNLINTNVLDLYPLSYYNAGLPEKGRGIVNFDGNVNLSNGKYIGTCYEISADELRDKTGEIKSATDLTVTVDATKSGRMTLAGNVTVNGKEFTLDAEKNVAYTSVQWSPVPKATAGSNAFLALKGQQIKVIAQLVDKNGNAVTEKGEAISFSCNGNTIDNRTDRYAWNDTNDKLDTRKKAAIVKEEFVTDEKGQAELILKSSNISTLINVKASCDSRYDVKLYIAESKVDVADLYWVDANLYFNESAYAPSTTTSTTSTVVTTSAAISAHVGSKWEVGVLTKAEFYHIGVLKDKKDDDITITGLGVNMKNGSGSVGTLTAVKNGTVLVTSEKAKPQNIVSTINSSSATADLAVNADSAVFAGTGATTVSKKLTVKVQWQTEGLQAEFINPTGTYSNVATKDVYLKVCDQFGNAIGDKIPAISVDDNTVNINVTSGGALGVGLYKISLTKTGMPAQDLTATTTLVAKVSDDLSVEETIVWTHPSVAFQVDAKLNPVTNTYKTVFDKDSKTVTLVFTEDVDEASAFKKLFTVEYSDKSGHTKADLGVTDVTVNGNEVVLKLKEVPSTVDTKGTITVSIAASVNDDSNIAYSLTSVYGDSITNLTKYIFNPNEYNTFDNGNSTGDIDK